MNWWDKFNREIWPKGLDLLRIFRGNGRTRFALGLASLGVVLLSPSIYQIVLLKLLGGVSPDTASDQTMAIATFFVGVAMIAIAIWIYLRGDPVPAHRDVVSLVVPEGWRFVDAAGQVPDSNQVAFAGFTDDQLKTPMSSGRIERESDAAVLLALRGLVTDEDFPHYDVLDTDEGVLLKVRS